MHLQITSWRIGEAIESCEKKQNKKYNLEQNMKKVKKQQFGAKLPSFLLAVHDGLLLIDSASNLKFKERE